MPTNAQGPSSTYTQELEQYKAQNPGLTVGDIQVYNINRSNYFAGTIAVCVIYGVFCLVLLLITIFSPDGSKLITETFRTFTITFIIGMIIAIVLLTMAVVSYKPKQLTQNPYDSQMCPDYWDFKETDENSDVFKNASTQNQYLMQYRCVNTNKLGNYGNNIAIPSDKKGTNEDPVDIQALYTYTSSNISTYNKDSKLDCTQIFPGLLNSVNVTNSSINNIPNALACGYAQQCGIAWTDMCPANSSTNIS